MSKLVEPHGGRGLKTLLAPRAQRAQLLARAQGLTKVPMTSREVSDVLMMAMGAYTPLDGFMGKGNWRRVCLDMKLKNGVFWPIPITLSCDKVLADSIHVEEEVARLVQSRLGASIEELTKDNIHNGESSRTISGCVLSGRTADAGLAYLGRYHEQVSVIPEGGDKHLFGWTGLFPWLYSATRTFLKKTGQNRSWALTTAQNGRFSGMLPTRAFENVMPLDILPSPLFRALLVKDTDQAQALGCLELDEEDLALCSFVCPAKNDYGSFLRINLDEIEREG